MRFLHRTPYHFTFGLSAGARFFFEEDNGGAGTGVADSSTDTLGDFPSAEISDGTPPIRQTAPLERVEGEQLPNFGALGKKPAAPKPAEPAQTPPEATKTPETDQKPPGGDPGNKPPASKTTGKAIGTPAKVDSPVETPPEPPKPPTEAKTPEETAKPPVESKKETPKIPTDAEIEALQPQPNAPTKVIKDFGAMRTKMKEIAGTARQVQEEAERLRAENETLKKSTGQIPEEVQKELEGLRNFNYLFRTEQDPRFKQQFEAPVQKAEESVYSLLQKHGLPETILNEIKEAAKKAGGDLEAWPRWGELESKLTNTLDRQQLINARQARIDAITAKRAKLEEIGGSREKFQEHFGKMEEEEKTKFATEISQASTAFFDDNPWIFEQDVPANATAEQRKAIEAHNATVKQYADAFGEAVRMAYDRNPQKVAEMALNAVKAGYLQEQLTATAAERDKANTRVRELEAQIAKIKSAGRMAHVETPAVTPGQRTATTEEGKIGGDGSSAIQSYFSKRN